MAKKAQGTLSDHQKEHELMGLNKYDKGLIPSFESLDEFTRLIRTQSFEPGMFRIGYKLYAYNGESISAYVTSFDTIIPTVPYDLVATATAFNQIDLTWSVDTTVPGITGFNVYRNGALIGVSDTTSYSDKPLEAGITYVYSVAAFDYKGNVFGQSVTSSATTPATDTTAPTIPGSLSATAISSTRIDLAWTASTDASGSVTYKIYRGGVFVASSNTNSYSDIGLTANTMYSYTVSAIDSADNESAQSGSASATTAAVDSTAPTVPSGLSATAQGPSSIALSWTLSTDAVGVTGYKVYRDSVYLITVPTTVFTDTGLSASTNYVYTVSAIDAAGNESAQSGSANATTTAGVDNIAPSIPANLVAASGGGHKISMIIGMGLPITEASTGSDSEVVLTWDASTDNVVVAGYKVYRNGLLLLDVGNVLTYTDASVAPATTYSYTVTAYDPTGNASQQSTAAVITTPSSLDTIAPTVPTGLSATAASTTQINLSWNASSDAVGVTGYKVYRQVSQSLTVGYVGASMSMEAVAGAIAAGSTKFWSGITSAYSGGGPWQWAQNLSNSSTFWAGFNAAYTARPTTTFWLELCAVSTSKANETLANCIIVVNEIKRRAPGAVVYVSSQPDYTNGHVCNIAGSDGPSRMATLAAQLVSGGYCLAGPPQGPLNDQTELADLCHPNTAGEAVLGAQLNTFFDALAVDYAEIGTSTTTSYSDTTVAAGTSYTYKVSAYDAANNESGQSATATATTSTVTANKPIGIYSIDSVIDKPFVSGMLYRTGWKTFETTQGVYNFSSIATKLNALPSNQKLSLVIFAVAGPRNDIPAYIMDSATASGETYNSGTYGINPYPWNEYVLTRWDALIEALSNYEVGGYALKDHPKLANIDCSLPGCQGIRLPSANTGTTSQPPGYTLSKFQTSTLRAVRSVASRFPNKNCYVGLFGIGGPSYANGMSDARAIRDALLAEFNGVANTRINFFQETMTGKVPEIGSNQGNLVYEVRNQTSIMLQACWRWSQQSTGTQCNWATSDTPQKGFDNAALFGTVYGVTYVEMYNEDLNTAAYQTTFQNWHDQLPPH